MTITAGVDVGTGRCQGGPVRGADGDETKWLAKQSLRVRQRDPLQLAGEAYDDCLEQAGLTRDDVGYVATTGEGETVPFHTGHFYSMTTHARGAIHLKPGAGRCSTLAHCMAGPF